VEALVDGACDREALARDAIFKSLEDIGRRKFSTVLETAHGYLTKHNKVEEEDVIISYSYAYECFPTAGSSTSHHSPDINGEDK
jgi:hypothetical protein